MRQAAIEFKEQVKKGSIKAANLGNTDVLRNFTTQRNFILGKYNIQERIGSLIIKSFSNQKVNLL